jgi:hypothetical protein
MALYTVHVPASPGGAAADPLDFVFVKDGFCWPALFIPVFWLIFRRLWLVLLIYLAALAVLAVLGSFAGDTASSALIVLFALYFALEANGLRRWTIERRGGRLIGVVEARSREEAERRFFAAWVGAAAPAAVPPVTAPPRMAPPPPPAPGAPEVVGLFPAPGAGR